MSIRAILVDDEPGAVTHVADLLAPHADVVSVVGSATSGAQAVELAERMRPDAVFADIRLGDMSGFDVIASLSYQPHIVFVTAYDSYAIKAFEHAAIDYLLKPVDPRRLQATVERLAAHTALPSMRTIRHVSREVDQGPLSRISTRIGTELCFVDVADIDYIEAQGYYAALYCGGQPYPVRMSLQTLEQRLAVRGFLRIHRKYIVNMTRVVSMRLPAVGKCTVALDGPVPAQLPVSRGRVAAVRKVLESRA
ncbi:MAG: response regulator [Chitinivibrionales bacterium]|nr:response regulator [Chitinivibrionales bacterium]